MYVDKRKDRQGNTYYSFSYIDKDGIRVRLKKSEHPYFSTREDAQAWARTQEAYKASKKAYIERKLAWRSQYYDFGELLEKYGRWQKVRAPNSFQNNVAYLEHYIFPFFLGEKHCGNANDWHLFFREFTDWLTDGRAAEASRKKKIEIGTANNIIRSLNTFLTCLSEYNQIDPESVKKCPAFPDHMLNRRDINDVILPEEMVMVRKKMAEIDQGVSDFFFALWHTGMRFAELFGLPMITLFKGDVPNASLHDELTKHNISYYGYIYLDSQPKHDDKRREKDMSIARKPLKGFREISPKNARIIPIRDKDVWNILARRYKSQAERFMKKTFTMNKVDYMLWEELEWNKTTATLRAAYEKLKIDPKQYHCCRHSFTTLLVGETRSFFLVRAITGHRKDKSFERYLHIYEQVALAAKQKEQVIEEI